MSTTVNCRRFARFRAHRTGHLADGADVGGAQFEPFAGIDLNGISEASAGKFRPGYDRARCAHIGLE